MLVRVKKSVVVSALALSSTVISLPVVSFAATSPTVTTLSPLSQGLSAPVKMVLGSDGSAFVADQRVGGIVKLDAYGVLQKVIRTQGTPAGLAFAQDGSLLVSQGSFVARYDVATGAEQGRLTGGNLQSPAGIAVDGVTGYVYVADSSANQVEMYTATGIFVKAFGKGVSADASGATVTNPLGALSMPTGVAFEKVSRQIAVADTLGHRVQFFTADGTFVKSVGNDISTALGASVGSMQFFSPVAVAFEYSKGQAAALERMYIVDQYQSVVQVVDPATLAALAVSGAAGNSIGSSGTKNGQLMVPSDAIFDAQNGRLLVVNNGNITAFGIDGGANPVYVAPPPSVDPPPTAVIPAPAFTVNSIASLTNVNTVVLTGTVDVGSTVQVGNQAAAVVGGAWSYTATLAEGVNSLSLAAQKGTSEKAVAALAITLDTTPPALVVSALSDGSNAADPVQNISGFVSDQNGVTVTVNGAAAVLTGGAYSVSNTLQNGANLIKVMATDAAGNSTVNTRTVSYLPASALSVVTPVDSLITANSNLVLTGSVAANSTVTVGGVAADIQGGTWSLQAALKSGLNTLEIVAKDAAGVTSSIKRTVIVDADKPNFSVESPVQDLAVNTPNVNLAGTVVDATQLSLAYTAGGVTTPVSVVDGKYSFSVDFTSENTYPVTITAKDAAGNSSTIVRNVIYDVTPPAFTLNQASGVMPDKLSGTVESGATVSIKDGAVQIATAHVANGLWTANLAGVTYSPESLLAVATDAAGNSSAKSLSYKFADGTLNGTGKPTVQDALRAIRFAANSTLTPSANELAHYDITGSTTINGKPTNPNGKIEIVDAILILRKALGLTSW